MEPTESVEQPVSSESLPDSMEDRIASIFGGAEPEQPKAQPKAASEDAPEETEAVAEESAPPAEETFELEVDGEKFLLPKKLEKGYMQERDYTQKSQQLADQRRLIDTQAAQARAWALEQEFVQNVSAEQTQIAQLDAAIKQYAGLNWSEMTTDDIVRHRMNLDGLKEQRASLSEALEGKRGEFQKKLTEQHQQVIAQGQEYLSKKIPGWGADLAKQVAAFAVERGIPQAEVSQILNPVHVEILYDAMKFRELQSKAKPAVVAPRAIKTTPSNPMSEATKRDLSTRKVLQKSKPNSPEFKAALSDRIAAKFGG